jgi:CAAX protease family protein
MTTQDQPAGKPRGLAGALRRIVRFPLTRILLGAAACLLVTMAVNSFLLEPVLALTPLHEDWARAVRLALLLPVLLGTYALMFGWYEGRRVTELAPRWLPGDGAAGFLGGLAALSLVILVLRLLGCQEFTSAGGDPLKLLYPLLVLTSLAAIEEVLFRGILYRILESSLGTSLALVITGPIFGLSHVTNEHANLLGVVSAGAGGLLLGALFSLTKRLWWPIFFHAGWNFAQVLCGSQVSGMDEFLACSPLRSRFSGPDILTGGASGLENSIVTIAIVLLLFSGVLRRMQKGGLILKPRWRRISGGPDPA